MAKKKISPLMRKYNALRRKKKAYCSGKATKADVNKAATAYINAAVKKGQSKVEATKKANRVRNSGCKMSSVAGTKRKSRRRTKKRK